jgi:arginyl-tRNA synthetase
MWAMPAARWWAMRWRTCWPLPAGTVTREYYINDGGAQVDVLARSAYERYREAHGLSPEIAEGLYPGDYLIPVGEALKAKYGDRLLDKPESVWLAEVREFATA